MTEEQQDEIYTVDDWIELREAVMGLQDTDSIFYANSIFHDMEIEEYSERYEAILDKTMRYIKTMLEIHTEPIIRESILSGNPYLVNIWTRHEKDGLIIAHSKRKATEEEILKYTAKEFEEK